MDKSYSGKTFTRFQAASRLITAPLRQQPENSLEVYFANNNNKSKTINLSFLIDSYFNTFNWRL